MHLFEISSVTFDFKNELRDTLTLVVGNSATGKTLLTKFLSSYADLFPRAVHIIKDVPALKEFLRNHTAKALAVFDMPEQNDASDALYKVIQDYIYKRDDVYFLIMARGNVGLYTHISMYASLNFEYEDGKYIFKIKYKV